jgi:hypothetical protein
MYPSASNNRAGTLGFRGVQFSFFQSRAGQVNTLRADWRTHAIVTYNPPDQKKPVLATWWWGQHPIRMIARRGGLEIVARGLTL